MVWHPECRYSNAHAHFRGVRCPELATRLVRNHVRQEPKIMSVRDLAASQREAK